MKTAELYLDVLNSCHTILMKIKYGGRGGTRTRTPVAREPKSRVYTNFTTRPLKKTGANLVIETGGLKFKRQRFGRYSGL